MCISCSSMSFWYWHCIFVTQLTGADDQLGRVELHQVNLAPSPHILSRVLSPIRFNPYLISVARKGCYNFMMHKLARKVDHHLIFCHLLVSSPNHGVVVIGFGSICSKVQWAKSSLALLCLHRILNLYICILVIFNINYLDKKLYTYY